MVDRLYRHSRLLGIGLIAALINACGGGGGSAVPLDTPAFYVEPDDEEWGLVWSDEFDGTSVNADNWEFQIGDGTDYGLPEPGWGNGERQWYTAENASIGTVEIDSQDESALIITAMEEAQGGMPYTSSRLRTKDKFDFTYGRVEIRAKAAAGQGLWSAIWMMPTDSPYGTWAASGEMDIVEVVNGGTSNEKVFLSAHHGFQWPQNQLITATAAVEDGSDWHTYALEWTSEHLRWYIDGVHLRTVKADSYYSYFFGDNETGFELADSASAPFDTDFHLIMNLAVGGTLPGYIDNGAVDGATLEVDYVRVYKCQAGFEGGLGCNSNANRDAEDPDERDDFIPAASSPYVYETVLAGEEGVETLSYPTGNRELQAVVGYDNDGAITVDASGNVIAIESSGGGNVVINDVAGDTFELNNFYGAGELKFDMYIDSAGTAPFGDILIKMDSGWPALGQVSLSVSDLPKDEWFSYSVPVRDLVENPGAEPLNLQAIVNLMVVEPTASASLQVRNVSLKCGTPYRRGCGVSAPPVAGDGSTLVVLDEYGIKGGFWGTGGVGGSSADVGFQSYFESGSNHVQWNNTGESLLVNFTQDTFGVWFVRTAEGVEVDLGLYEDAGFLRFELKAPEETIDAGLLFKVENTYPDGTGDLPLDQYIADIEPGVWTEVEIPVSALIASTAAGNYTDPRPGAQLDISAVQSAIVLWPAEPQQGLFFEIRSVRYENDPGAVGCPGPEVFGAANFSESFGGVTIQDGGIYTMPGTAEGWGGFANTNTDMYRMAFPYGGTVTFTGSVPNPAEGPVDVEFRLENLPYLDSDPGRVEPSYNTTPVSVSGVEAAEYSVDIPATDNTFGSLIMYLRTQDAGVQLSNIVFTANPEPCAGADTVLDPATFNEAFGGTTAVDGVYTYPDGAESWGGFANTNVDIYPIEFPHGGKISFTASVPAGESADVRFRFENLPYSDADPSRVEPSYNTEAVTVSTDVATEYVIDVPSQGENTFESLIMYLDTREVPVAISNVVITISGEEVSLDESLGFADFSEAFGGTTAVDDVYTYPDGAESWGGFANMNTDLYPMDFPYGGEVVFTAAVPAGESADVRFRFENLPYSDADPSRVEPSYNTAAVTVSSVEGEGNEYTIEIPEQGENTFESLIMYLDTREVAVIISEIEIIKKGPPPAPNVQVFGTADFSEAFGGTTSVDGVFTYPDGAESWGGFANMNTDLYPMDYPSGGVITFNASVATGESADVRFRFENLPYSDADPSRVEPSYNTEAVTVDNETPAEFTIEIPSQGDNTFESLIMYLDTREISVTITDVVFAKNL